MKINIRIKNYINFVLDAILLLSIIVVLASSYILCFILPLGMGYHTIGFPSSWCNGDGTGITGNYVTVFDWPRYTWIDIHNWAGLILLVIVLFHIILHWDWVVETTKRLRDYIVGPIRKVVERYVAFVTLLILFLFESLSGFIIWLILPRGELDHFDMVQGFGRTFWNLQRNVWVDLHAWMAITIVSVLIIHLVIHWRWIVTMIKGYIHRTINRVI
jgi:hypothetical protein